MDRKKLEPIYELVEEIKREDKVLIYGAGAIADKVYKVMKYFEIHSKIESFIVNKKENNPSVLRNIPVNEYIEYVDNELKVIIGLSFEKQADVCEELLKRGFDKKRLVKLEMGALDAIAYWDGINFDSGDYWNQRYLLGGNSGTGSYNHLAEFKAEVINHFVAENMINTVLEWGCGDGNQLSLANYPNYTGLDVSEKVVELCRQKYKDDVTKDFIWCGDKNFVCNKTAELVLSLDVIFHLVEDDVYHTYMTRLFGSSEKYVCIYSSNCDERPVEHMRQHKFTEWIDRNTGDKWKLREIIKNKYPYDANDADNTSISDFYFYEKIL